jgi:thiamine-phosphate pyrophosphorylase
VLDIPQIYPITDTRISGLSHLEQVDRLIAGGARLIQLREKYAVPNDFYEAAVPCIAFARARGVRIIINDRADIALAAGADGVHLGQGDMPPNAARDLLGGDAIIGYSTHSLEQAKAAAAMPVDYIAIGPIFTTSTKEDPDPVIGLQGLRAVKASSGSIPIVAIGGITASTIDQVMAAGADSAAVINDLLRDPDRICDRMRRFIANVQH